MTPLPPGLLSAITQPQNTSENAQQALLSIWSRRTILAKAAAPSPDWTMHPFPPTTLTFFTSWTDSREVWVVEEVIILNNHHHQCRCRIRGVGKMVRWWGGMARWHCHTSPPEIWKKCWGLGGLPYATINNGRVSIANEISSFRIFKYLCLNTPAQLFKWQPQHTTSWLLPNRSNNQS